MEINDKEFQDTVMEQATILNKLQIDAFNAGYKQGLKDGQSAELDKQMKEQAQVDSLEGVETTETKVGAELLNEPQ